jgi:hypothetical protein
MDSSRIKEGRRAGGEEGKKKRHTKINLIDHPRFGAYGILLMLFGLLGSVGVEKGNVFLVKVISYTFKTINYKSNNF